MLLKTYRTTFLQELSALYDAQEIESFFYLILECFHNKKRIDLALDPNMEMDAMQLLRWESVLSELKKEKPIQYILGETEFYGLPFLVNERRDSGLMNIVSGRTFNSSKVSSDNGLSAS